LGRSGKDGWFRDIGREPYWKVDPLPSYFVPGYEHFQYEYGVPDADHITAYIPYSETYLGTMPAFEENLRKNGWVHHPGIIRDNFANKWTKVFPSKGFRDYVGHREVRQRYFVKYQSFPELVEQNFNFMGKHCDDGGSDNIGLDLQRIQLTDRLRAISSTKYFCDPIWDGVKRPAIDLTEWMRRASWLFKDPYAVWKKNIELMPNRYQNRSNYFDHKTPLNKNERTNFCTWILPIVAVVEKKGELQ
jgi:hypothetical protein